MKVLWLCNTPLIDNDTGGTGTWLGSMARELMKCKNIELGIIALASVKSFERLDYKYVTQWLVPAGISLHRNGLPSKSMVINIVKAVEKFSPDLIHIWGTETFWGLLSVRGLLNYTSLLEIQGLKGAYYKFYFGGMTFLERLKCIGFKELIKRKTMNFDRRDFALWGMYEKEIIRGHKYIDVQSPWVISHVTFLNQEAKLFKIDLVLREQFYEAKTWQSPDKPTLFCSAAYSSPYKGLHVAIRALSLLRTRISNVRLRIAGAHQRYGIRQEGYLSWINNLIRRLGLVDNIDWLGPLNSQQIINELRTVSAIVVPTFTETYCMGFVEAMFIGTPAVVSYVGGIPSLARDEESCLFFQAGDEMMCAYQLERIINDKDLAISLSTASRKIATVRNDRKMIAQRQLSIYSQIYQENHIINGK